MPWLETDPMDQRSRFIDAYLSGAFKKTELCERFHISRRVGDKWIARYDAEGRAGLRDRSRAPKHCPHRIGVKHLPIGLEEVADGCVIAPSLFLDGKRVDADADRWD